MAEVDIKHAFQSSEPDNPTEPNAVNASRWNAKLLVTGGVTGELFQRDTSSSTGVSTTLLPTVTAIVYSLTPGQTPPIGGLLIEDDGTTVTIKVRRLNGDVLSMEIA